jgi:hypothetical protein
MIQAFVNPAEQRKVISLAEYRRRRIALSDNEHPPPSPCPAAAGKAAAADLNGRDRHA